MELSRRNLLKYTAVGAVAGIGGISIHNALSTTPESEINDLPEIILEKQPGLPGRQPNIVIIYADDLGYGDLGCYGNRQIKTPNIDRLSEEGIRFTDFYSCNALCSPSRYGLLTGRYPQRGGLDWPLWAEKQPIGPKAAKLLGHVLGMMGVADMGKESDIDGIPEGELTIAEALKQVGYRTGMVGKWHLGDFPELPQYHPLNHGFDEFFGLPYSNGLLPLPLYRNREMVEENIQGQEQAKFSRLYAEESIKFMETSKDKPFFLYLAHTFPHRPLYASEEFRYKSNAGLYGDVVEELDHFTGRVLDHIKQSGIEDNTLVVFASDNGPWHYGSPGGLRGSKGQSFEGGFRIPMIAKMPGRIAPGTVCHAPAMITDLFPTILPLAGLKTPEDRIIDGKDIGGLLTGKTDNSPHDALFFYHHNELEGVRVGRYKYYRSINTYKYPMPVNKTFSKIASGKLGKTRLLFDLERDPSESYNLIDNQPETADQLEKIMVTWEKHLMNNRAGILKN
jgi:arylsulfatase A